MLIFLAKSFFSAILPPISSPNLIYRQCAMYLMELIILLCAKLRGDNIARESLLFCGINRNCDVKVSITEKTRANLTLCTCAQTHANLATAMSNFFEVIYCLFVFHFVRIQYEFPISHADWWKNFLLSFSLLINHSLFAYMKPSENWKDLLTCWSIMFQPLFNYYFPFEDVIFFACLFQ